MHQGAATQAAAAALSATDSTHGDALSLSAEPSAPESLAGRALIAHELAHVVQHHAAELGDDRSQPGHRCEPAADRAAQQAVQESSAQSASGGVPPTVQRQPQAGDRVAREEVRMALEGFLRRAMHAQGGRAWWVTPEGRNVVIGLFVGDAGHLMAIETWLNSPALPDDPVELAGEVARRLPETIDHAWLERLKPMSGQAPAPAAMIEQAQEGIGHTVPGRTLLHQGGASPMVEKFLIGESAEHRHILEKLSKIAATDAEVLISGPSGVGKELYAHYVHQCSPRKKAEFVPVNCGALPVDLLENELFGHVSGAFTGARPRSDGLVAAAEGGTLFLDEVDALALVCQVKLLRFLQEKEYRRLGETRIRRANVRIIAATNTDLLAAVHDGRFREDLFFRLRVVPIEVPALRERRATFPYCLRRMALAMRRHTNYPRLR